MQTQQAGKKMDETDKYKKNVQDYSDKNKEECGPCESKDKQYDKINTEMVHDPNKVGNVKDKAYDYRKEAANMEYDKKNEAANMEQEKNKQTAGNMGYDKTNQTYDKTYDTKNVGNKEYNKTYENADKTKDSQKEAADKAKKPVEPVKY